MKKVALLPLALISLSGMAKDDKPQPPNIIFFLVDDMGWQDTSVPFWTQKTNFNKTYETPNMERLAARGMKFTQAYASSVSSPSRCSLLTGMNAARHRVTNWTINKNESTDRKDDVLRFPDWNVNGICEESGIERTTQATPLPQLLKDNGYYTIHCGKAHFGAIDTPGANPLNLGFDVNIAGHAAGGLASYLGEQNFGNRTDGKPSSAFAIPGLSQYHGKDIFVTEALTLEAIKALEKAKETDKPFFLYMAHYAIHAPINKDKRFYQKYSDKGLTPNEACYAALIEGMDKSLGDLMNYLEANNQMNNTIIIFMSDNGGLAATARTPPLHIQNAPLNSGKGSAYEGGIREPMIISWPGVTAPASVCDKYMIIEDFYPTILEMAGVKKYHTIQKVDGKSLVSMIKGKKDLSKGRSLIWNIPNLWDCDGPGIGPSCTIRKDDWKLIYYYKTGKKELFNIKEDIGEKNNLASENPKIVKELSKELGRQLRKKDAQRPSYKSNNQPVPWPDEI